MRSSSYPGRSASTQYRARNPFVPLLRAAFAVAILSAAAGTATAQVTVSVDGNTGGSWIGNYGSCAYIIPGAQSTPGIEVPIIGDSTSSTCSGVTCAGGVPPIGPGGGNYGGGASNKLLDCQGQTHVTGFSDAITYSTRLCSAGGWPVPTAMSYVWTNPNGQVDPNGCQMQPGYLDAGNLRYPYVLQFPTDPKGVASCTPLGVGCTARPNGRIASTWDDAGELTATPPAGAGLCIDIDLSAVPAAQRALNYKLSGYFLDYDRLGRDLNVQLINGVTNSPIAGSSIGSFQNGAYLSFNNLSPLPTKLTLQVNRITGADVNAVISGLFIDRNDGSACGTPHITLKKLTNGVDTPLPSDGLAPVIAAGQPVTWTYIATNDGTEDLVNVNITDNVVGFICGPFSLAVGASQTCTKSGVAQAIAVPPGVAGTCAGVTGRPLYENMGSVAGTGQTSGVPVSANYLSHYCNPAPGSFTVTKSPKNASYNIGDNISFSIVVTSTGPGTAQNVVLNDPLPTLGNLSTWIIGTNPGNVCTIVANTLNCPFGDLANGQSRSVTVMTNVAGGANASACPGGVKLNNTATVTATGLPTKTDTGDYTCTPPTNDLKSGDTATIGFWANKNGQGIINCLNGGSTSTALATWLSSNFPNLYGNLAGKTNADVAAQFTAYKDGSSPKTSAQVMAVALAVYVTNSTLSGGVNCGAKFGFNFSATGTGAKTYNVGPNGTGMGLQNNTSYTIMQLLQQANLKAGLGPLNIAFNVVFDGINTKGDIT